MSIPAVKPGGYGPRFVPTAAEFEAVDEQLSERGLDSLEADSITGTLSLKQDPGAPSVAPKFTTKAGVTGVSVMSVKGSGGRINTGTPPKFATPRTRTVRLAMTELFRSASISSNADDGNIPMFYGCGVRSSTTTAGNAYFIVPIAKPMRGAKLVTLSVHFWLPAAPTSLPDEMPILTLKRVDPIAGGAGLTDIIAIGTVPTPASTLAWFANGAVQTFTVTTDPTKSTIDISTYKYIIELVDAQNGSDTSCLPVWNGFSIDYENITDERPQQ